MPSVRPQDDLNYSSTAFLFYTETRMNGDSMLRVERIRTCFYLSFFFPFFLSSMNSQVHCGRIICFYNLNDGCKGDRNSNGEAINIQISEYKKTHTHVKERWEVDDWGSTGSFFFEPVKFYNRISTLIVIDVRCSIRQKSIWLLFFLSNKLTNAFVAVCCRLVLGITHVMLWLCSAY